jgi:hypothetical protein
MLTMTDEKLPAVGPKALRDTGTVPGKQYQAPMNACTVSVLTIIASKATICVAHAYRVLPSVVVAAATTRASPSVGRMVGL